MQPIFLIYVLALFLAAIIGVSMAAYAQRHWKMTAARPFSFLMGCVAWWGFFAALSTIAPSEETAIFLGVRLRFSAVVFISAAGFLFALASRGYTEWLNGHRLALILVIPFLSLLLNLSADFHQLFVFNVAYEQVGNIWLRAAWSQGAWFQFVHIPYSYLLLIITVILLANQARQSRYPYRQQSFLLIAGAMAPIIASIPATFNLLAGPDLDIIVIGFLFMGLAFGWALSRFHLLDIMPIARSTVIENMADALLILDNDDRVVELNKALYTQIGISRRQALGQNLEALFDRWPDLVARYKRLGEGQIVITVPSENRAHYIDVQISPIIKDGRQVGRMIAWRDITQQKETELALEASLGRMAQLSLIAESLSDFTHLPDLFQTIVERVARALPANRASLIVFNREAELITHFVAGGVGAEKVKQVPYEELMEGLSGWVLRESQSALSPKNAPDPRESAAVRQRRQETDGGSIIVVPLIYRDQILGTMTAINCLDERDFTRDDVDFIQAVASQAAVAIENSRLYTAEQQQVEELKESNEALQAFSHMVAHDLKGPLSIMVGYAEVILLFDKRKPFNREELYKYVEKMVDTGEKMSDIINELLMLANIRRQEELPLAPLDIGEGVEEVLLRLKWSLEKSQAKIIKPDNWPMVVGYSPWVEENWVNYINNAIKYGGECPTIELGFDEKSLKSTDQIRFWVRDDGPGLTAEEQSRLFKEFSRVGEHKIQGHGLGLSIVRRITERMGGEVGVESEPGVGSTFYFTLPRETEP